MRKRLLVAIVVAATAVVATQAASAATPKTVICGQIKHGPNATYTNQILKKQTGTTWTVFATGVPCAPALKSTPAILKLWAKAKIEDYFRSGAFLCSKEDDGHGKSGSSGCSYSKGPALSSVELMMTGSYSVGQLKQMFYIG